MAEATAHVPILVDTLTKTPQYVRLHEIMSDKWNLATIFDDWETDFPGTTKPARSWKSTITSLGNMFLEGGNAIEAVETAFSEGPDDTPFPFGVDLGAIGGLNIVLVGVVEDQRETHSASIAPTLCHKQKHCFSRCC